MTINAIPTYTVAVVLGEVLRSHVITPDDDQKLSITIKNASIDERIPHELNPLEAYIQGILDANDNVITFCNPDTPRVAIKDQGTKDIYIEIDNNKEIPEGTIVKIAVRCEPTESDNVLTIAAILLE